MNSNKRARGVEKKPAALARPVPPPPAVRGDADAATPPPAEDEPVAAAVAEETGGGVVVEEEEVDDDDEQVERFYALLANIRAMRGLLPPPYASCDAAGDAGSARKRLRAADPPWRPAFRMEDFEVVEPAAAAAPCKKTKPTTEDGGESASGGARPAVVVTTSPRPDAAVRSDSGSYKD